MNPLALGTQKSRFEATKSNSFQETVKLKEGVNTIRLIAGPVLVETIWYPTLTAKEGSSDLVQAQRPIIRPKTGCVLDALAKLDENLTKTQMREDGVSADDIKKYRSQLRPNSAYRYLCFSRNEDDGGKPTVRVIDLGYKINKTIEEKQNKLYEKDKAFLEFGLAFMYDIDIKKVKDPKIKNPMFATSYVIDPVTDTLPIVTMKQRVPASWLNWDGEGEPPWEMSSFFTEEELEAIEKYEGDLDTISKTPTAEEIEAKLTDNPLFLSAVRDDKPMFPMLMKPEILEQIEENYKNFLSLGDAPAPKQLSSNNEQAPVKLGAPKTEAVVEEAVIIEDVKPLQPKPVLRSLGSLSSKLTAQAPTEAPAEVAKPAAPAAPKRKLF